MKIITPSDEVFFALMFWGGVLCAMMLLWFVIKWKPKKKTDIWYTLGIEEKPKGRIWVYSKRFDKMMLGQFDYSNSYGLFIAEDNEVLFRSDVSHWRPFHVPLKPE